MFVEELDKKTLSAVFSDFFAATAQALVDVFDKSEGDARALVESLDKRFADAPACERNLLLHNDPVALASTLAEVSWSDIDAARLEIFNRNRRLSARSL